jgi:hypothetical protein
LASSSHELQVRRVAIRWRGASRQAPHMAGVCMGCWGAGRDAGVHDGPCPHSPAGGWLVSASIRSIQDEGQGAREQAGAYLLSTQVLNRGQQYCCSLH